MDLDDCATRADVEDLRREMQEQIELLRQHTDEQVALLRTEIDEVS